MAFWDLKTSISGTKLIFQDFPGPRNFRKKSRTFQEVWGPWYIHLSWQLSEYCL